MDGPPGLTGAQGPAGGKGPEGLQGQKVSNLLYTTVNVQRDIYIIIEVISLFQWIHFSAGAVINTTSKTFDHTCFLKLEYAFK